MLPNSFSEDSITMISEPGKENSKKENYKLISLMNVDVNILNKISAHQFQPHAKRIMHHYQLRLIPGMQGLFSI